MRFVKKRGSRKKSKRIITVLLSLCLLILIFAVIKSDILKVRKLEVGLNNASCVKEKEITDNLNVSNMNMVFIDEHKLLNTLQNKFTCIGNVKIQRIFPNTLKIQVSGRDSAFAVKSTFLQEASVSAVLAGLITKNASSSAEATSAAAVQNAEQGKYFLVDNSGMVFADGNQNPNVPIVWYWNNNLEIGDVLDKGLTDKLLVVFNKFKELNLAFSEIRVYPQGTAIIPFPNIIILNLNKDLTGQLAALQLIVTQAKMSKENMVFVDLRFDKPVVQYAPRNK